MWGRSRQADVPIGMAYVTCMSKTLQFGPSGACVCVCVCVSLKDFFCCTFFFKLLLYAGVYGLKNIFFLSAQACCSLELLEESLNYDQLSGWCQVLADGHVDEAGESHLGPAPSLERLLFFGWTAFKGLSTKHVSKFHGRGRPQLSEVPLGRSLREDCCIFRHKNAISEPRESVSKASTDAAMLLST